MTAGGTVVACAAPEDAKLARDVVDAVNVNGTVDLRYSAGPEEDQARGASHDYQADVDLPGLSVTGDFTPTWWPRATKGWVARRVCEYADW